MIRIIVAAPAGITLESLTEVQQAALQKVFTQHVIPMSGTTEFDGKILIDAIVADNFIPQAITDLALPFEIIGMWQWSGSGDLIERQPLDTGFIDYLPPVPIFDPETRAIIATAPAVLHEPRRWSGWPEIEL